MAKQSVIVLKAGSPKKLAEAETLGELRQSEQAGNMLATVNGDTVTDDSFQLSEHDYVTFTEQVKGAAKKASKPAKKKTTAKPVAKTIAAKKPVAKKTATKSKVAASKKS